MRKIIKYILSIALLLNFAISDDPNWEDDFVANDYEFGATLSAGSVTIDGVGTVCGATGWGIGDGGSFDFCLDFGDYTWSMTNTETYSNETQITISWDGTDNNGSGSVWCCKITPQFIC